MLVQRDDVDLGAQAVEQSHEPPRVGGSVVHVADQHVLEGDAVPGAEGIAAARVEQGCDREAPIERHQLVAHRVGGGVE